MTTACPARDEWLRHADGEVTANRAAELDTHGATCGACRHERDALAALLRDLRAPAAPPAPWMVARVMARLDQPTPSSRPRRWPFAAALGAAAVAVLVVIAWPAQRDNFEPRGGTVHSTAGVELYALGGELHPLADRAVVTADTAYVASYRNIGDAPAYALVFAIDAAREVHWLYPAFTDPATDPEALRLAPVPAPKLLAESVVLDHPATGPLTLIVMITDRPLHVSDVERIAPEARTIATLRARWPQLRSVTVTVR